MAISYRLYFFRISKVWSMLHHGSVGRVQRKQCNSLFTYTVLVFFFVVFHQKISVDIALPFIFFDKVSNFCNRILTNRKQELVIGIFWWSCMLFVESGYAHHMIVRFC